MKYLLNDLQKVKPIIVTGDTEQEIFIKAIKYLLKESPESVADLKEFLENNMDIDMTSLENLEVL